MTRAKRIEAFAIALTNRLTEDDYTVLLGSDEFNALRAALSEEGEEPLPQGFPYTVPGEEYSRGFKDGVEAAAKEAEGYAVQKQTQHLHPTAYALREVATRTRSLAPPSPAKDEAEPLDPLIEPLCRCGFMAKEAARWIHRADCELRVPPQPAPVSETKGECEPVRPAYKMKCQPCGGTGRVWSEGASRPCDACASTGRRHEP